MKEYHPLAHYLRTSILTMTTYVVKDLQRINEGLFISLENNINQGQTSEAIYYCTLVLKQGRTLSIFSRPRLLLLLLWKNKPHTFAYLQTMDTLPPWKTLPRPKYEKYLNVIQDIKRQKNVLNFLFRDQEDSWDMQFKSDVLAGQWRQLIRQYSDQEGSIRSTSFDIRNFPQITEEEEDDSLTLKIEESQTESEESWFQSREADYRQPEEPQLDVCEKRSKEQQKKQSRIWRDKEMQMLRKITLLEQKNTMLQLQNLQLSTKVKELKDQSSRLKIGKVVLNSFKEEYSKRYEQLKTEVFKRNLRERHLMIVLSQLVQERKQQQGRIERLSEELQTSQGHPYEKQENRDILLEQLEMLVSSDEFDDQ